MTRSTADMFAEHFELDRRWRGRSGLPGPEFREALRGKRIRRFALTTEQAHQALGQDPIDRRNDEVGLDPHVNQPADHPDGVPGVDGREHEVSGQGGTNRDLDGFLIPNLADQDDIRILSEDGAQPRGEGETNRLVDLGLIDALDLVLDRVFQGDDLRAGGAQGIQRRIQRRGLPAAGRAGDQDHPVRPTDDLLELPEDGRWKADFFQRQQGR